MKAFGSRSSFHLVCAVTFLPGLAWALFAEDAGVLDFLVATAGHGSVTHVVHATDAAVITSDSSSGQWGPSTSCVVASRATADGGLLWRRHVCLTKETANHAVVASKDHVYTNDASGSVRAWTLDEGALVWDAPPAVKAQDQPRVWADSSIVTATSSDEKGNDVLTLYSAADGHSMGSFKAGDLADGGTEARWLHVMPKDAGVLLALVGPVSMKGGEPIASKVSMVEITVDDTKVQAGSTTNLSAKSDFLVSSMQLKLLADRDWHVVALTADSLGIIHFSLSIEMSQALELSQLHPLWTSVVSVLPGPETGMLQIIGRDNRYPTPRDTMAIFRYDGDGRFDQWYAADGEEETSFVAITHCPASKSVVVVELGGEVSAFKVAPIQTEIGNEERITRGQRHRQVSPLTPIAVSGNQVSLSGDDAVIEFKVVSCNASSMTALLSTARYTTVQLTVSGNSGSGAVESKVDWMAEEGLSQVSDALLLDASHSAAVLEALSEEEEKEALQRLPFSSRLQSQMDDALSFLSSGLSATVSRDIDFGFVKVAMLLSQTSHRVWGMPTSGASRGTISWMVDLPWTAQWHIFVHGTASSKAAVHGINGGTFSPEVLVLSSIAGSKIDWKCMDGLTGEVHSSGLMPVSSPVVQTMPLFGGFGVCRQHAVVVHEDRSVSIIPGDEKGKEAVLEHIESNQNGLYTHIVDRKTNVVQTFQIRHENSSFILAPVGHTAFPGERIVEVAYPERDEVVQSPCKVLGDDSLLLKYLNPHLAVIVTASAVEETSDRDEISSALGSSSGGTGIGNKRKPMGATQPEGGSPVENAKPAEDDPNLFVNVVDTVSGRVLYRASHSNASSSQHIPVLISENWIIYAYFNEMVRRTEIGVLTLYEGMIDKKGLTAFSSPEQTLSFSSLDSRDAKPVVLTKTYVNPKPVTAIGITDTRGGISSRQVLFATGDDRLMSVPRQLLEPRRPTGDVKESEKMEGLFKYTPLIPFMSLMSPSYNQTIDAAKRILSTSAGLESQSLVLAYGGADIFFARLAPSKGFDLLPDDYNRILLSVVVFVLLVAVGVLRSMGSKKIVAMSWS